MRCWLSALLVLLAGTVQADVRWHCADGTCVLANEPATPADGADTIFLNAESRPVLMGDLTRFGWGTTRNVQVDVPAFKLVDQQGVRVFEITQDGRLLLPPGRTPDRAARLFYRELRRLLTRDRRRMCGK